MIRSSASAATSMQKTYDDAYLQCSTAVYFEKQNNEEEALRSWRSALDSIYYHNAYRMPAGYRPKNETEKALQDSLRDMELQCKERVDLLDTLRRSRTDAQLQGQQPPNGSKHSPRSPTVKQSNGFNYPNTGVLGQGTVPAVSYNDIVRPVVPQRPPPQRPSYFVKKSSDSSRTFTVQPQSSYESRPLASPPLLPTSPAPAMRSSRTPSPDKKGGMFRTTLRKEQGAGSRTSSGRLVTSLRPKPAASQAATLAWPGATPLAGLGLSNTNGSTSSLPDPSNGVHGRQSAEAAAPASGKHQQSARMAGNGHHRSPSPADFTAASRVSSMELPVRPRSNEPARQWTMSSQIGNIDRHGPMASPPMPSVKPQETMANIDANALTGTTGSQPPPPPSFPSYRAEYPRFQTVDTKLAQNIAATRHGRVKGIPNGQNSSNLTTSPQQKQPPPVLRKAVPKSSELVHSHTNQQGPSDSAQSSSSEADRSGPHRRLKKKDKEPELLVDLADKVDVPSDDAAWDARVARLMKNLPKGVDEQAAKSIFNEIVIKGDEVHWDDIAGLDAAKNALKEAVVYPFLRPDLFMGLREPARGMLLFGPPGTGKTMLARAVATESRSTFFAISASSLTSKYLGESEKLVRALFQIAKALAPSIIFVDEIDSLLSQRAGSGEHEATRRIKTEFLIQWSDLAKAAAGRESNDKDQGDATRVLVLAATNLPWAIDEAARRRFVRRQYIPLPEAHVREAQLRKLLSAQKHQLNVGDMAVLLQATEGFSGSDITALAKDAAMGPLRSLGEKLLHMSPDDIRPIMYQDFEASLINIRPSVSHQGLKEYEDWAREFGERGG